MGYLLGAPVFRSFLPVPARSTWLVPVLGRDVLNGGNGTISGTVKEKGTPDIPVARRVWLMLQENGRVVRSTWSDTSGNYTFPDLDPTKRYFVVAFDHTENYRAVIADNLTPVTP